ncbi:MAG: class I SAM-dependent methyltransferase [Nitrosomonadales bacterium]|nr:class I SAM-dependent methyltransferase [Nitrosomonadales bacterium]
MHDQPYRRNPLLRASYTFFAPVYDVFIEGPMRNARRASFSALPTDSPGKVLISGVGTGLDLPLLPDMHRYTALDFNPAMLARARPRAGKLDVEFVLGDSMDLPFADAQFDCVVLHLILAVVPEPQRCLSEAARVLKPGGTILLFDKFLHPQQRAPLRRLFNVVTRRFATRMDVVFENVLGAAPDLQVVSDVPLIGGGWFRSIVLRKP